MSDHTWNSLDQPGHHGHWTAEDKEVIERVQKAAVKMISGLEGKTYEERCREIGLDSMERRKEDADMIQTFKIIAGEDKVERGTWFQLTAQNSQRTTRATEYSTHLTGKRIRTEARTVKVSKGNYCTNTQSERADLVMRRMKWTRTRDPRGSCPTTVRSTSSQRAVFRANRSFFDQ